jgi:hypothetical protein
MADDIVKRLRTSVGYRDLASALFESATEIERLRAENERLCAVGDELANAYRLLIWPTTAECLINWQEVRRD